MSPEERLYEVFKRIGASWRTHEHPPVFTVEESAGVKDAIPGGHTKNLFLVDKNGGAWLVSALAETRIDLKALARALGVGRFSFGKPELMAELLGVTPGSVTVFALINDRGRAVRVVLDAALFDDEIINCHPLRNNATTSFPSTRLLDFLRATGHDARLARFDSAGDLISVE